MGKLLTSKEMTRKIGVSLTSMQRWERKGGKPHRLVCQALNRLFRKADAESPFDGRT